MTNWKEYKLGEIASIKMGQSPKSDTYNNEEIGLPFFQGNRTFGRLYPTIDTYCSSPLKIAEKNDVLFSVRAPVGDINYSPDRVCIGRGLCSIRSKSGNQNFLFYLLNYIKQEIINKESGTVFGSVNKNTLENIRVSIPDLPTQTAIAEILSSLDDKIELNNKINQELENLAQTLFKHWFIDFEFPNEKGEPYKSSGGELVDSELGEIPKGWEVSEIGLVAKLGAGGDKPKIVSDVPTEEINVPIYSNGITNDGLYGYTDKAKIFEESVTISARGTIGFVCLRSTPFVPIVRLISAIADEKYISTKFLYMWLKNQNIYGNGTTQQQLTVPDFKSSKIIIPTLILVEEYTDQMNGIIENINFNKLENQELTNLRDTLLPKLISGELEVAEVMAEKA